MKIEKRRGPRLQPRSPQGLEIENELGRGVGVGGRGMNDDGKTKQKNPTKTK